MNLLFYTLFYASIYCADSLIDASIILFSTLVILKLLALFANVVFKFVTKVNLKPVFLFLFRTLSPSRVLKKDVLFQLGYSFLEKCWGTGRISSQRTQLLFSGFQVLRKQ